MRRIKIVQDASLDEKSNGGYKIENDLLFGTNEWFSAIDHFLNKHVVNGIITRLYMSGHDDYPEFEIENEHGKTIWTRQGIDEAYIAGKAIELIYVEQKYKHPTSATGVVSKCVIEIKIEG